MTAKIVKLKKQVPPAPAHLSARAKAQWEAIAPGLATRGVLRPENHELIAVYCSEMALVAEYDEIMAREGSFVTGEKGISRPHPLSRPRAMASARIVQYGKRLGIFDAREAPKGEGAKDPCDEFDF